MEHRLGRTKDEKRKIHLFKKKKRNIAFKVLIIFYEFYKFYKF